MFRLFMGALIAAGLSACVPSLYSPNQLQTPMLREAGEFQATAGNGNVTAAVAVTDNVHLHGGAYYDQADITGPNQTRQNSQKWLAEAGLGVGGGIGLEDLRWELLAGGGYGRSWAYTIDDPEGRAFDSRLARGYLQPNLGFVTPFFELIGSARLSGVRFLDFSASGFGNLTWGLTEENVSARTWLFLEPSVTVKLGYRWIKLYAQPVWTLKLNPEEVRHRPFNLYVGVSIDLAKWHGDWKFGG